jgi:O-antigen/teichoic acid export membrane protein
MFSTVASSALGMLFWVVAARLFTTDEVGRASAGVSAISLIGGMGQLGLGSLLIRFVPLIGSAVGRFLSRIYVMSATICVVLAFGFVVFGAGRQFLGSGAFWGAAFCVAVLGACVSSLQDGVLTALKRTTWVPVENIAIAVARLGLMPALVATSIVNPVLVAWAVPMVAAVVVITAALFGRLLPQHTRQHAGRVRMPGRRDLIQFISAGYADGLLGNLSSYLPPVIVTAVLGPSANAVFFVPWLVGSVIQGLLWNIASSFVVEASSDAAHTRTYLRHATRLVLVVCAGATVGLVVLAPWLLALLGKAYATGGTTALRLVGLSVPFNCVILTYIVSLLIQRRNWAIFRVTLISSMISVPLFVLGMYHFGVKGVVGGFLVSDVIIGLSLLPTVVRRYRALANRTIDDDVTMVVDLSLLRATLAEQDQASAARAPASGSASRADDDETTVLDLAALRASLHSHSAGGFVQEFAPWSAADDATDQTVVLPRLTDARPDQTVVLPRMRDASQDDETTVLVGLTDATRATAPPSDIPASGAVGGAKSGTAGGAVAAGRGNSSVPRPRRAAREEGHEAPDAAVAHAAPGPETARSGDPAAQ